MTSVVEMALYKAKKAGQTLAAQKKMEEVSKLSLVRRALDPWLQVVPPNLTTTLKSVADCIRLYHLRLDFEKFLERKVSRTFYGYGYGSGRVGTPLLQSTIGNIIFWRKSKVTSSKTI